MVDASRNFGDFGPAAAFGVSETAYNQQPSAATLLSLFVLCNQEHFV
jgi:hypothetical protein